MSVSLALSRVHFPITALGPGRRIGIWFQGCSLRCDGCISVDTWATQPATVSVASVVDLVSKWAEEADGLTISGGEPFDQAEALMALLKQLRPRLRPEADVLIYSGHSLESLQPHLTSAAGLIDALITDPFQIDAQQTQALRGSDNQRLHLLTPLGRERLLPYERARTAEDDHLDLMMDTSGTFWMAGVPKRGDLERLRLLLAQDGHQAWTSEHRSATLVHEQA